MELMHIPTPKRIMTFKQFMAYQEESKKDTSGESIKEEFRINQNYQTQRDRNVK